MKDKKYKITIVTICTIGFLSIIGLVIATIILFKNASLIEVISRM